MNTKTKNQVLNEIEANKNEWLKDDSFKVHTVDAVIMKDDGIYVGDLKLGDKALTKMLYRMQLTDKFIDYKKEVERGNFKQVFDNIVGWNKGKQVVTVSNGKIASDVFFYKGQENFNPSSRLSMIIDGVYDKISQMNESMEIHKFSMDTDRKVINFSTVDPSTKFNAVGNDEWVLGSILGIGLTEAFASPYYGRLVCTNGLVDGINMRKFSLSGKGYTEQAISQMISRGTNLKKLVGDHIKEVSATAIKCETSLSEYLNFRKIMSEGLNDDQKELADVLFPLYHIEDAYGGKDVFNNNEQWKTTAKSGVTVYELLNDITKWTTHDKNVNNPTMKNRLNEKASMWFMKGQWHNKNVAPNVEIKRRPCFSDSVPLV